MKTTFTNQNKAEIFHHWLGGRFQSYEVASPDTAPISFVAKDNEDKDYYVFLNVAEEPSVKDRQNTGIKIANTHFYTLYGMISQDMNVFYMETFADGYMLFYLNDCCTGEQLKVTEEFTAIGVTSCLHIELPKVVVSSDETSYTQLASNTETTEIVGSLNLPKAKVTKRKR
jgi:hypothetical protein